ncbi:MAG: hypothetical protein M1824_005540 [Vezdaea acicularis]|nr:MAG: hypothetical protein M1824_005540 [Vezdaea acicularis]
MSQWQDAFRMMAEAISGNLKYAYVLDATHNNSRLARRSPAGSDAGSLESTGSSPGQIPENLAENVPQNVPEELAAAGAAAEPHIPPERANHIGLTDWDAIFTTTYNPSLEIICDGPARVFPAGHPFEGVNFQTAHSMCAARAVGGSSFANAGGVCWGAPPAKPVFFEALSDPAMRDAETIKFCLSVCRCRYGQKEILAFQIEDRTWTRSEEALEFVQPDEALIDSLTGLYLGEDVGSQGQGAGTSGHGAGTSGQGAGTSGQGTGTSGDTAGTSGQAADPEEIVKADPESGFLTNANQDIVGAWSVVDGSTKWFRFADSQTPAADPRTVISGPETPAAGPQTLAADSSSSSSSSSTTTEATPTPPPTPSPAGPGSSGGYTREPIDDEHGFVHDEQGVIVGIYAKLQDGKTYTRIYSDADLAHQQGLCGTDDNNLCANPPAIVPSPGPPPQDRARARAGSRARVPVTRQTPIARGSYPNLASTRKPVEDTCPGECDRNFKCSGWVDGCRCLTNRLIGGLWRVGGCGIWAELSKDVGRSSNMGLGGRSLVEEWACACNGTYVSQACCGSESGMVWGDEAGEQVLLSL